MSDGTILSDSQSQTGNANGGHPEMQICNAGNNSDPFGSGRVVHLFVISYLGS